MYSQKRDIGPCDGRLGIARALRAAGATCDFASGLEHKTLIERDGFCFEEVPITTKGMRSKDSGLVRPRMIRSSERFSR